ncbi:MAG: DUF4271 domain-containing protein [Tannerellaceae bacterium]|jgi:hypothetical protein|nr:DUF4271 domain-containing protein [Tannerellaceae bacterium]
MDGFEGYVGIQIGDRQLVDDVIFTLLFGLLIVFAIVFHSNCHLFMKMTRDIFHIKDRLSLFEDIGGNETAFRRFMTFQSLFLFSVAAFLIGRSYEYIPDYRTIEMNLLAIGVIFVFLSAFYLFKQLLYNICGFIFAGTDLYKTWRTGYTASTGLWGVLLYIPVLCLAFTGMTVWIPLFTLLLLYLVWRIVVIYKTVYIFNIRGVGFIYIILYLCAQEILPVIFLYEGIVYLYNIY